MRFRHLILLCLALWLPACATAAGGGTAAPTPKLSLSLTRADGRTIPIDAYAGQPLLLFLFASYDEASQIALVALTQFLEQYPTTATAAIMLQPDAATFLPLFKQATPLPFEIYCDPDMQLMQGETGIGEVRAIPAFVALDAQSRVREVRYGVQSPADLAALMGR